MPKVDVALLARIFADHSDDVTALADALLGVLGAVEQPAVDRAVKTLLDTGRVTASCARSLVTELERRTEEWGFDNPSVAAGDDELLALREQVEKLRQHVAASQPELTEFTSLVQECGTANAEIDRLSRVAEQLRGVISDIDRQRAVVESLDARLSAPRSGQVEE